MKNIERTKRIVICVVIFAVFAFTIILGMSLIHKTINPEDNKNENVVYNPGNTQDGGNTDPSGDNTQTTTQTTEVITHENLDEEFKVNKDTKNWITSDNKDNTGVEVVNNTDSVFKSFDEGNMFEVVDTEKLGLFDYDEDWLWWVAIDTNSSSYSVYISFYDYCNVYNETLPLEERKGTKPIKLEIEDKDIKEKLRWCINNYPEGEGKITDGLHNAQYLLFIRDVSTHNGYSETQNLANTRYGTSWAGINFKKLMDRMR